MDHGCLLRMRLFQGRWNSLPLQRLQGLGQAAMDLEVDLQLLHQTTAKKSEDRHPQGQCTARKLRETPTASLIKDLTEMARIIYQSTKK